ncbi:hypothetical protein NB713_001976 [Xanthomonas sacchari]|nr:hypothetical protein [Xanthomonas sacchari]
MAVAARQQGRRAVVAEALVGGAVGLAAAAYPRHEQGLLEIVARCGDAQGLAHRAGAAVGTDQQARVQDLLAAVARDTQAALSMLGVGLQRHELRRAVAGQLPRRRQAGLQRLAEVARDDHLAESLASVVGGFQPHPAEIAGAADVDAADRSGRRAQPLHHPQRAQRVDRGGGEAEIALVEHRRQRARRRGLDQAHVHPQPVQGDGQAGADQAAADDHYVMSFAHPAMIRPAPVWAVSATAQLACRGGSGARRSRTPRFQ